MMNCSDRKSKEMLDLGVLNFPTAVPGLPAGGNGKHEFLIEKIISRLVPFRPDFRLIWLNKINPMITRIWHGRTSPDNADYYLRFLQHEGTREYLQTEGILSVKVLRRKELDCCHFWTVTEWTSFDAIKRFAGENYERAKYYPEDADVLLEFEEKVIHCESWLVS
jgi:hypothetical protein